MVRISFTNRLDPQMIAAINKQQEHAPGGDKISNLPLEEARRLYCQDRQYWNSDAPDLPEIRNTKVKSANRDIPVRLYFPTNSRPLPALVYLHGGGWILGNIDTHDKIMRLLALRSGAAVVGIDYSLSPEYKFPAALEETAVVLNFLHYHGDELGVKKSCMAIGGDSAGANMAMASALMMRSEHPELLKLILLFYGAFGLRDSASRRFYGGAKDGMGEEDLSYYISSYLRDKKDLDDVRFNILSADFKGLAPVFISAAEYDPLIDDSTTLKRLLDESSIPNELKIYKGVLHGFLHYSRMVEKAFQAIDDAAQAIHQKLFY